MLSPSSGAVIGFQATDPSANASSRTGGTYALGNGYCLDSSNLGTDVGCSTRSFVSLGVDGSGNLWVAGGASDASNIGTQYGSQLSEFIGIAVPGQTPLSSALVGKNTPGTRP
jgi:hypothetical protein